MSQDKDEKSYTSMAVAACQIAASFFDDMPDYTSPEVLSILDVLEHAAKKKLAPHQKRLGIFDLDDYVFMQIADAVTSARTKVLENAGQKNLTTEDIDLVLFEIKTDGVR